MTTPLTPDTYSPDYLSRAQWTLERPHVLVVCCSDGRLQEGIDEFLHGHLGIGDYDRVYAPGGPGALTPGGPEFTQASQYRDDLAFLVRVHQVEELVLIFHGSGPDGPDGSTCAYYGRILPGASREEIQARQARDLAAVQEFLTEQKLEVKIKAFRAEVQADRHIQMVPLETTY